MINYIINEKRNYPSPSIERSHAHKVCIFVTNIVWKLCLDDVASNIEFRIFIEIRQFFDKMLIKYTCLKINYYILINILLYTLIRAVMPNFDAV